MLSRIFALCVSLALATGAPAADPMPRQATGKWIVDFHAAQCVASREYGTSEKPLILALKASPLGGVIELSLLRPGKAGRCAQQVEAQVGIGAGEPLQTSALVYSAGKPAMRVVRIALPVERLQAAKTASSIHVRAKGELEERLAVTQLGPLLKVMDECVADLRRVWNVVEGEGALPPLQLRATGELGGLFSADDYPEVAVRNNQQGRVSFAMLINEEGRVADCTVIETSGVAALDAQGCATIAGMRDHKGEGKVQAGSWPRRQAGQGRPSSRREVAARSLASLA